jgi:hypothetical protein
MLDNPITFLLQFAIQTPLVLVWMVGIGLSIVHWRRYPRIAPATCIACALFIADIGWDPDLPSAAERVGRAWPERRSAGYSAWWEQFDRSFMLCSGRRSSTRSLAGAGQRLETASLSHVNDTSVVGVRGRLCLPRNPSFWPFTATYVAVKGQKKN